MKKLTNKKMQIVIPLWQTPLSHQANIGVRKDKWGRIITYKKSELAAFQQQLGMLIRSQCTKRGIKRIMGPYSCTASFYLKNHRRPDMTNLWKTVEDSLEGILFDNDRYCEKLFLNIEYDELNPRLEIEVTPLSV